jgi:protein gp37
MARRLEAMGQAKYAGTAERRGKVDVFTGKINLDEKALTIPLRWKKPRRVFVNSMSDLFHESVPDDFIDHAFAIMALCERHTFQVLTKRPERMADYMKRLSEDSEDEGDRLWKHLGKYEKDWPSFSVWFVRQGRGGLPLDWPLPNVWLGVSVEDQQRADERIPLLVDTPAVVRFISYEPALGPVEFWDWITPKICKCRGNTDCECYPGPSLIDQIIVGGESGHGARPMHPDWARSIRDQCVTAGVPFFFKQWGAWVDLEQSSECREARTNGHNPGFCPIGLDGNPISGPCADRNKGEVTVYQFGKKAAGRMLDGREWSEFPAAKERT